MAKFKTVKVSYDGSRYNELKFSYDVYINSNGKFYTTLPEDVVQPLIDHNIKINHNLRTHKPGYFENQTFNGLVEEIDSLFKEFMSKEVIEDKIIIRYNINTNCTYVKDGDEIYPNGFYVKNFECGKSKWKKGTSDLHATNSLPFGFEIYVEVKRKITYKFKTGTEKVIYDRINVPNFYKGTNKDYSLVWIDNIVGITNYRMTGNLKEIDYTEQRAKFFVDLIKSICLINEKIIDYLEPESIIKVIESNKRLL